MEQESESRPQQEQPDPVGTSPSLQPAEALADLANAAGLPPLGDNISPKTVLDWEEATRLANWSLLAALLGAVCVFLPVPPLQTILVGGTGAMAAMVLGLCAAGLRAVASTARPARLREGTPAYLAAKRCRLVGLKAGAAFLVSCLVLFLLLIKSFMLVS